MLPLNLGKLLGPDLSFKAENVFTSGDDFMGLVRTCWLDVFFKAKWCKTLGTLKAANDLMGLVRPRGPDVSLVSPWETDVTWKAGRVPHRRGLTDSIEHLSMHSLAWCPSFGSPPGTVRSCHPSQG